MKQPIKKICDICKREFVINGGKSLHKFHRPKHSTTCSKKCTKVRIRRGEKLKALQKKLNRNERKEAMRVLN